MPNTMCMGDFFEGVDNDSEGISCASDEEINNAFCWGGGFHGAKGKDNEPTHEDVGYGRECSHSISKDGIENNSQDCQSPDYAKQGPAKGAVEDGEAKGGVGACDEQIYR